MNAPQLTRHSALRQTTADVRASSENREPERIGTLRLHDPADVDRRSQQASGEHLGFHLLRHSGRFFAVPNVFGPVCLADRRQRSNPWIFSATSLHELRADLDRRAAEGTLPLYLETLEGWAILSCGENHYAIEATSPGDRFDEEEDANPKVLVEHSLPELRRRILQLDERELPGAVLGTFGGYGLTTLDGNVLGVPLAMQGAAGLPAKDRADAGVLQGKSRGEVEDAIRNRPRPREIQFTGWLPIFQDFGNCGAHPQFGHVDIPPAGYDFIQTPPPPTGPAPPVVRWKRRGGKLLRRVKTTAAIVKLSAACRANGTPVREAVNFAVSRDIPSQMALPRHNRLLFLTSVPYTLGQDPWVIEVEDVTSLLFPYVHNGLTATLDVEHQPGFRGVKTLLERPACRGIITHIQSTADGIAKLFQSPAIAQKTTHIPMGIRCPVHYQRHEPSPTVNLLFTNSWHQAAHSFYLRGGLDVLEAFAKLRTAYPELRLTLRTKLPPDLSPRYHAIIRECGVTVLDEFLPQQKLDELIGSSHVYLLPSARIHIMSVLQSMSYGLVPIVSDGWGMTEYVDDGKTGLVVPGRYGKVSWDDEQNGMLREDYSHMRRGDLQVTQRLVNAISQVADDAALRRELGQSARHAVQTRFNLARWNVGLKRVLDRAWEGRSA
ncbi:MAG TPA: glycosyltransferase family 4 protein [Planctomycetaceae bacterium]|jgi:glycosyltransferase involved in cell wall biosynthesis|nr:glycosyltransferase family 4 protein [Planctomycetaceae bacterium]